MPAAAATSPGGASSSPSPRAATYSVTQVASLVLLLLIALCAGAGVRVYGDAAASLPRVLYHRALAAGAGFGSGAACGAAGSVVLEPWRASAQVNVTRWQYGNISRSTFPDGAPVRHYDSPNSNVWGLAQSQVRSAPRRIPRVRGHDPPPPPAARDVCLTPCFFCFFFCCCCGPPSRSRGRARRSR